MKPLKRAAATAVALTAGTAALLTLAAGPAAAIVGGQDATQRYPGLSFVSIDFGDEGVAGCTGTLIAPPGSPTPRNGIGQSRWLATGAHCVTWDTVAPASVPVDPAAITIHEGSTNRTKGQTAVGVQVIVNPDWAWGVTTTTGTAMSDIALVKVDHALRGPVMQIASSQTPVGQRVRLAGWGLTDWPVGEDAQLPDVLQQKDVTRLPASACTGGFIGTGEVCAGAGACFGDSGSPAMRYLHGQWQQVGLGSRETVEGDDVCNAPTIYTDTVYFAGWMRQTMQSGRPQPCTVTPRHDRSTRDQAVLRRLKSSRTWHQSRTR
jgi:hypothetical protein